MYNNYVFWNGIVISYEGVTIHEMMYLLLFLQALEPHTNVLTSDFLISKNRYNHKESYQDETGVQPTFYVEVKLLQLISYIAVGWK